MKVKGLLTVASPTALHQLRNGLISETGKHDDLGNYRPVSLASILGKIDGTPDVGID